MSTKVELTQDALCDWQKLDGSLKKDVAKKIERLKVNPKAGLPLGNRAGLDLTGFRKIYACRKSIRIVYRILSAQGEDMVEVWAIGKREHLDVYKSVLRRVKDKRN